MNAATPSTCRSTGLGDPLQHAGKRHVLGNHLQDLPAVAFSPLGALALRHVLDGRNRADRLPVAEPRAAAFNDIQTACPSL